MKKLSETKLNRFLDVVEDKYLGKNPFKRFLSNLKFKKFCKETMKSSPSLGILWYFSDFIKLAERVYFYQNTKSNSIYSSRAYAAGENGFILNDKEHALKITVKLLSDNQLVCVQVNREGSSYNTEHRFKNDGWDDDKDNYDEVLIDNIIGIINSHMIALTKWCWNQKGSYDNDNKKL